MCNCVCIVCVIPRVVVLSAVVTSCRFHLDTEDYFFAFGEVSDQFLTGLVWVSLLAATLLVHPLFIVSAVCVCVCV